MKLFAPLYHKVMNWANRPQAIFYLIALAFAEASFFPIPPDILLAPMCLVRTDRAWWYGAVTTISSVLGGIFGYCLGMFAFFLIQPWFQKMGYMASYDTAYHWFQLWGFWALVIAAFSPVPYKAFTIAAGVLAMPLVPFIFASLVGRGARFFLVAGLMYWGGEPMERVLRKYVDWIGWIIVILLVGGYVVYKV